MCKLASTFLILVSVLIFSSGCQTTAKHSNVNCDDPFKGWEYESPCLKTASAWEDYELATRHKGIESQYVMGVRFEYGGGVKQNFKTAFAFYKLAAEQGHNGAQNKLGVLYFDGKGIQKSNVKSYMWMTVAQKNPWNIKLDKRVKKNKERIIPQIKPVEISEGTKLADECIKKNYAGC